MKFVQFRGGALALGLVLGLLQVPASSWGAAAGRFQSAAGTGWDARPALSAQQIISKAVRHAQQPEAKSRRAYTYTKVTLTQELDSDGRIKERTERTYQVQFAGGATEVRLVAVNGAPPSAAELKQQAEKQSNLQQALGVSSAGNTGRRENYLTPELAARFEFKVLDEQELNGRTAFRMTFAPKHPEPPAHHVVDRLLNRISGTLWIDAQEFEIARAEIHLGCEINLLGGVLGSLKKMAYTLTRTRVADDLWFNTSSCGDFEGRRLLDSKRIRTQSRSSNFRLATAGM